MQKRIGYVLMGFPRVSETFIASEVLRVERAGVPLRLFVVKAVEEKEQALEHPVVDAIRAEPQRLPDAAALTAPMRRWRLHHLRPFVPSLARCARRRPLGLGRAVATTLAQAMRDRRSRFSGPRKVYIKELLQAIALADRVLTAGDVAHLHAHFAHGTTTITWHAARIAGVPFSFTGHARDIYAPELNPHGWLRRKLRAAEFVVTCTQANVGHLKAIAPEADIQLVYHGLNADFARLLGENGERPAGNGKLRVLGVGRHVAKKGFDVMVDACAELRDRGVEVEALIVGQEDKHTDALRRRIAERDVGALVGLPGPAGQAELLREYRAASALCMPCRLLPNDRDGIPNVLVEAMAAGTPVVATDVSGIPELVRSGENGLLVPPDDAAALAAALLTLHRDRALAEQLAAAARTTVAERFDGEQLAGRLAQRFLEALR